MIPGSANPLLLRSAAATGYSISRSLRFNSSDSAYLSRTPASAGNRKTWTWAGWVKRSGLGALSSIFSSPNDGGSNRFYLLFDSNDQLRIDGQVVQIANTSSVYRDCSAWYHIVLATDTSQAVAADRFKIYVNGSQVISFAVDNRSSIAQNTDLLVNTTNSHLIGRDSSTASRYFPGYLADIHFIDGQALDPTSFGEFSATTGVWNPKAYTGTYGTNGFRLDFSDNSAATATTLGKDRAGSNNWTPNNLSVTAGAGNDSLVDVPTNGAQTDTGVGGEVRGNYATLNPLFKGANTTLSDGNLQLAITGESGPQGCGTIGMTYGGGNFYCEFTQTVAGINPNMVGLIEQGVSFANNYIGADAKGWGYYGNGNKYNNGSAASYGSSWGVNDVIGIAYKGSTGELFFYKNGTVQNSGTSAYSGLTAGPYFFAAGNGFGGTGVLNFGQRPFAYTAPSGFKALNTANLPAPVVTKPSTVMDVALYTGNNTARSITGIGFSPDFVWIKGRSGATDHALYDIVRGVEKDLVSNSTAAETTQTTGLTAFNSDGFSIGTLAKLNTNAATYAAWTWDAGSSTVTNTQGSISSQVRANASAGFSVVTWTGTGATGAVGHGLGAVPSLIICKSRAIGDNSWDVYHQSLGNTGAVRLHLTSGFISSSLFWNNTSPTSSVFTVTSSTSNNPSGTGVVAYCFAPVAGYSSFGSYTGNGSADGPFVYTNLRPAFVLIKATGAVGGFWMIYDNRRAPSNLNNKKLAANTALQENETSNLGDDSFGIDFLSNGFKIRQTGPNHNDSGTQYIYVAFAEHPFQYARAR